MINFKEEISAHTDELIALRRDFHKYPELGFQEFRTANIIENYLSELNLEVRRCTSTGIIGVLKGEKQGKTVLLRADIDALPVKEETEVEYASCADGVMHACGHDGHAAMLLIAAKILSTHKKDICGEIVFLFQPNEEDAGAEKMILEGALENPVPDAIFGLHLWSTLPIGTIGIKSGPFMASSYYIRIKIIGKGGHGAAPEKANNPIDIASDVLQAFQDYYSACKKSKFPTTFSICKITSGKAENVIPDTLSMEGTIRCLHEQDARIRSELKEIVERVCEKKKAQCSVEFECSNSLLSNAVETSAIVMECAKEAVTEANVKTKNIGVMQGDDFAEFTKKVKGSFYFIGAGNPEKKADYEHHNSKFNIDENALAIGVEMHLRTALRFLEH